MQKIKSAQKQSGHSNLTNKMKTIYGLLITSIIFICLSVIFNVIPLTYGSEDAPLTFLILPFVFSFTYCVFAIIASAFILKMNPDRKLKKFVILAIVFSIVGPIISNTDTVILILAKAGIFDVTVTIAFGILLFSYCLVVGDLIALIFVILEFVMFKKAYQSKKK
ncbi:MAG: hypothetical protein LBT17_00130 [Mycoplasmataceae bacterium]|jgi:hypothetical protein|nr:hypothetical protein [Mycoplasmataceae bacterium]